MTTEERAQSRNFLKAAVGRAQTAILELPRSSYTVKTDAPPEDESPLANLLEEIESLFLRFVKLPQPELALLLAVWIASTYTFKHFRYCGYLALRSATPGCGKSLILRLLRRLANGAPAITTVPTPAVLYRSTRPVLLLDEVDRLRNADKEKYGEVLAILNCGFEADAVVERCNKNTLAVETFPVYGPKALAGIEGLADTLAHRSFQVQMERSAVRMPRLNERKLEEQFDKLRVGLERWANQYEKEIVKLYESLPDQLDQLQGFDDRFQDIAEPLVVLATLADAGRLEGPTILPRLLKGLSKAAGRREPSGRERQLVAFIDDIAKKKLGPAQDVFVSSADLVAACLAIEDVAFIETPKKLSSFLKHFDLTPKSNGSERGYTLTREWVETWSSRYPKREEGEGVRVPPP